MRVNRTSKWKVIGIWISWDLMLFNFEHVNISWSRSYIRVKIYDRLNLLRSFVFNFEGLDIWCTWIGHPSEKLMPFEFLERFCHWILSVSIYNRRRPYIWIKSYGRLNLQRASIFNFKGLDIWSTESDIRVKSYSHLNFSRASDVQFWASQYIIGVDHTFESKVMVVWVCKELSCSMSTVSIYDARESDIRVKRYSHLNFSSAYDVSFWASRYIMGVDHTIESNVMAVWIAQ